MGAPLTVLLNHHMLRAHRLLLHSTSHSQFATVSREHTGARAKLLEDERRPGCGLAREASS